jgi:Ca2+-binding RTX toxin-like protein
MEGSVAIIITGTPAADYILGTNLSDRITGLSGSDTLAAGGGNDTVYGGDGNLFTTEWPDNDSLYGDAGDDVLFGEGGNDFVFGGADNDVLYGGPGSDRLDGGAGTDTVGFSDQLMAIGAPGVAASLVTGAATMGGVTETLVSIENLSGTVNADVLTGNGGVNVLQGFGGNDLLRGGGANDVLDGGTGIDTASFDDLGDGVGALVIDLTSGRATQLIGPFGPPFLQVIDTLVGIENVRGSRFDDVIIGTGGINVLDGGDGSDQISGGDGNDVLIGGAGVDAMAGGGGADRFVFRPGDTGVGSGSRDIVTDYQVQIDRLDLDAFDASASRPGDQDFVFIGSDPFTAEGQVRAVPLWLPTGPVTLVQGNTSGTGGAELEIQLSGHVVLKDGDFV